MSDPAAMVVLLANPGLATSGTTGARSTGTSSSRGAKWRVCFSLKTLSSVISVTTLMTLRAASVM
jgi:hypothetical protein